LRRGLPELFRFWRGTIIQNNPGYRHLLWSHANIRTFIRRHYRWFLPTFDAYKTASMQADAASYFFLYHFGGIYLALDTECLWPLDDLLDCGDILLTRVGPDGEPRSITNAVMISKPRQEFWLLVMFLLERNAVSEGRPEQKTGALLLREAVELYQNASESSFSRQAIQAMSSRMAPSDAMEQSRSNLRIMPAKLLHPFDGSDPTHLHVRKRVLKDFKLLSGAEKQELFAGAYLLRYGTQLWEAERWLGTRLQHQAGMRLASHASEDRSRPAWGTGDDMTGASALLYRRIDGLERSAILERYMLRAPSSGLVHILNLTAAAVLDLCDGQSSAAAIAATLQDAFHLPAAPEADVEVCLASLASLGLIELWGRSASIGLADSRPAGPSTPC
jgi:hypothetical protein